MSEIDESMKQLTNAKSYLYDHGYREGKLIEIVLIPEVEYNKLLTVITILVDKVENLERKVENLQYPYGV